MIKMLKKLLKRNKIPKLLTVFALRHEKIIKLFFKGCRSQLLCQKVSHLFRHDGWLIP